MDNGCWVCVTMLFQLRRRTGFNDVRLCSFGGAGHPAHPRQKRFYAGREYRGPAITCPHGVLADDACALCENARRVDVRDGVENGDRRAERAPGCRCTVQ